MSFPDKLFSAFFFFLSRVGEGVRVTCSQDIVKRRLGKDVRLTTIHVDGTDQFDSYRDILKTYLI